MKRIITVVLLCSFIIGIAGYVFSGGFSAPAAAASTGQEPQIQTYRDIPGITQEEIAAIEELAARRGSFTYGSLLSTVDVFAQPDGSYAGFAPLMCQLLSDLFGVPFIIEAYQWDELSERINSLELDFTGAVNMPADMECRYFHTSPITANVLSVFTKRGTEILSEYDLRGLKIGFYEGSHIEEITRDIFPRVDFEGAGIHNSADMAAKLEDGSIDAFITDTASVFAFTQYPDIIEAGSFPHHYIPATISTANPELAPVISVITKYLMTGGIDEVLRLYETGEREYAAYAIWQTLSDEERTYIDNLRSNGTKIPFGATNNRYPVAFYDYENEEFAGIALDVLAEISSLTGIEFYPNCTHETTWSELENMLKTGEIKLLSQLIPNEPRKEYAIWPDAPYFTARYALLSNIDYPFISIDRVPYAVVGFSRGTAEENKFFEWFPDASNYVSFASVGSVTGTDLGLDALERGEIDLFFSLDYTMLYESNYRENPNQKINILFDEPVEPVPFGINKEEELLCSIISKAQNIINTEKIARNWTSRIFDQSAQIAQQRVNLLTGFSAGILVLLAALTGFFIRSQRLKKNMEKQAAATFDANLNLRLLIDMAPAGIVITNKEDAGLLYANKVALDMFGLSSFDAELTNRKSYEFMPEFQPDGRKSVDVLTEYGVNSEGTAEHMFEKQSGEVFLARVAYCEINYFGTTASLNILEDMTAERENRQRLREIARMEQEANQLKSQFLATMSHEIRTPMNAIIGMTDLALRESDFDIKNDHLLTIKQAGANLLSLINDILDFSKIEAGKMDIVLAEYSIDSLLSDVVNIIRMRIVDTMLHFAVKVDSDIPKMLLGDETRIRQAVLNILNNAVKYTEEGHVTLSVRMMPVGIFDELNLIFEVKDTGIGIREKDINRIFSNFTQLDIDNSRTVEGVGLGLAITRNIVETMGGKIEVWSEYGEGSTFTLTIPQKRRSRDSIAKIKNPYDKRVLVFECRSVYAGSVIYALSGMGVISDHIDNEERFKDQMNKEKYDWLIVSHEMFVKANAAIREECKETQIAVLARFGEMKPGDDGLWDRSVIVLTLPVYCTVIADIINGEYVNVSYSGEKDPVIRFTAPDVRVLVVDDIRSNLKVAEGLLLEYGMQVDTARSGADAIEAVKCEIDSGKPYDLVFMDHKMPVMDGVEATRRIREMAIDVPIIALTANAITEVADMFMKNGFNDFLPKPINTAKLADVLEKWIPKSKQQPG